MKKVVYSYEQFEKDTEHIARKLKRHTRAIRNIYGIPRGGLVLAVYLSYRLGKPLLLDHTKIGPRTLVVDDIAETGGTLARLLNGKKCYRIVTLFATSETKVRPHLFVNNKKDWIIYPWETKKGSKYDKTKF